MATQQDIETLRGQIEERKQFFAEIIPAIIELIEKRGTVDKREMHSGHTNVERSLSDFGRFSFALDEGQSVMGGSELCIAYDGQPHLRLSCHRGTFTAEDFLKEGKLRHTPALATTHREWDQVLLEVLRDRDAVIAKMEEEKRQAEKALRQQASIDNEYEELRKEATRLGLVPV